MVECYTSEREKSRQIRSSKGLSPLSKTRGQVVLRCNEDKGKVTAHGRRLQSDINTNTGGQHQPSLQRASGLTVSKLNIINHCSHVLNKFSNIVYFPQIVLYCSRKRQNTSSFTKETKPAVFPSVNHFPVRAVRKFQLAFSNLIIM